MSTDKISRKNTTEVQPTDANTELTEEELAKVSGGFQNASTGTPFKTVSLGLRKSGGG